MILLSFDIEEFDAPLEHGVELPFDMSTTALINATINGLGISVLPNRMIIPSLKQGLISTVNVQDLIFSRNFYIIYHKDKFLTPSIKQFINLCKEYV